VQVSDSVRLAAYDAMVMHETMRVGVIGVLRDKKSMPPAL